MITYDRFFFEFGVRRMSQLGTANHMTKFKGLPTGSILHVLDPFNRGGDVSTTVVPDMSNPLIVNGPDKKQVCFITPGQDVPGALLQTDTGKIKPYTVGVEREIRQFKSSQRGKVIVVDQVAKLSSNNAVQGIVCYNPMYRVKQYGMLRQHALFNYVLSTVVNQVVTDPQREHFIHVPVTDLTFTKVDFDRAIKEQTRVTMKYPELPHYLMVLNILAYLNNQYATSIFDGLPDAVLSKLNFVFTNHDKIIVYRLDTLKGLDTTDTLGLKVLKHLNRLSTTMESVTEDATVDDKLLTIPTTGNRTGMLTQIPTEVLSQQAKASVAKLDATANRVIEAAPNLTSKQKTRLRRIASTYKEIEVGGEKLETILTNPVDQTISMNAIDFINDARMDPSTLTSSVTNLASDYAKKSMKKDVVASLTSFSSQGMFLTKLETTDIIDDQNRMTEYSVRFEDVQGKTHSFKFTLPIVDKDGRCYLNGATKVIKTQRINTPICKVSPTRVTLSSNFNKTLVERNTSVAHSLWPYLKKLFAKVGADSVSVEYGSNVFPDVTLSYEYAQIAEHVSSITTSAFEWVFTYNHRFESAPSHAASLESQYGTYFGKGGVSNKSLYYIDINGVVTIVHDDSLETTTIIDIVTDLFDIYRPLKEWVELKVLNKKLPVIFVLCYRFGLTKMLDYLNVDYKVYEPRERFTKTSSDIVIQFKDKKLVIPSTPKHIGLIFGGLHSFKLKDVYMEDMDGNDIYYDLITQKHLSINYLKGIDTIFEMFIDPVTADVLFQMGEPTNVRDLLIRATVLLTTADHNEASSSANFRYRTYEQVAAIAYNKMARSLATYKNNSVGAGRKWSISGYAIIQAVMNNPLMENVDIVNPITDMKTTAGYSHIGEGGRTSEAFVIQDRKYPKDGVGIISEATVDSGKVAIDGMLSVDPTIVNTRGLTESKDISELGAANILSATAMLYPGADIDD